MTTRTKLRDTGDAFTNAAKPNHNYGDVSRLTVNGTGGSERYSFLQFAVDTLPNDAIIESATLVLTLRNDWSGTNVLTAQRVTTKWAESRVTFDNSPSTSGVNAGVATIVDLVMDDVIEIDVTAMISQVVAGAQFHGFRLDVDTADQRHLNSRENSLNPQRPRLVIEFGTTPTPPTSLHPRAGNAVNSDKPVLAWDVDTQSASWVQVATDAVGFDPDTGLVTPEFDDGDWVVNPDQLYDLSTTGYGGVGDDEERWWTVKVQDEDGNASSFAEPAQLFRHTYGTFVIDSPTTDVDTSTPTILTTFTGRTLTRVDWLLRRSSSDGWLDVSSGSADDDDFEITGVDHSGEDYQLLLKAFDEFPRGNVPNEPPYVLATVEFTYVAGVTDSVSSIGLAQAASYSPVVLVTVERDNAPDTFGIYRDGVLVATVDSGDAFVSDTTYEFLLYAANPQVPNEIGVVATDDGEDSPVVSDTITPTVLGVWLMAPDAGLTLPLFGVGGVDRMGSSIGEEGETFFPIGGDPVRIVDSVRGLEGTISGDAVRVGGIGEALDAAEARERLLAFKALGVGANTRIAFGRRNFPAILGQFGIDEGTEPEETYHVTVPFWSRSE